MAKIFACVTVPSPNEKCSKTVFKLSNNLIGIPSALPLTREKSPYSNDYLRARAALDPRARSSSKISQQLYGIEFECPLHAPLRAKRKLYYTRARRRRIPLAGAHYNFKLYQRALRSPRNLHCSEATSLIANSLHSLPLHSAPSYFPSPSLPPSLLCLKTLLAGFKSSDKPGAHC